MENDFEESEFWSSQTDQMDFMEIYGNNLMVALLASGFGGFTFVLDLTTQEEFHPPSKN